jgi:TadE-like protein
MACRLSAHDRRDGGARASVRALPATRKSDRGANTLELALLTPILLLVILFVVQFALVFHARHVALAAAQAAARVAREQRTGDWQAAARSEGVQYVNKIGPQLLTKVEAVPDGDANQRGVTVGGYAIPVVPFFKFHVSEHSSGPIECYRPDVGTGETCAGP